MKRVLLTGATGFLGRHCLSVLRDRTYEVHAVSSRSTTPNERGPNIHWHQANLFDPEEVASLTAAVQPSHLLHFAWETAPGIYVRSMKNFHWVQASLNLLQAFAQHGGQRVVMAGTCAEYDGRYGYCSEVATPLVPATPYGVCKHALHLMLEAFARQQGLSVAWGRIFFAYGPYEHPSRLVASVIRSLLKGKSVRCSHGNQIRDFLYIQDAAEAFVELLDSRMVGAVNVASGCPIVLKDVIGKIADQLDQRGLIQLGALPPRDDEPLVLIADVHRLKEELRWQPKYDLDRGLRKTIQWWTKSLTKER